MKTVTKLATGALAMLMAFGAVGCGGDKGGNGGDNSQAAGKTTVQMYYWKSGLGIEFMEKIVADFNAQSTEYFIDMDHDSSATTIMATLGLGKSNKYDLYFTMLNSMQYKPDFIKLDEVLDSTPTGETKTIREKYNPALLNGVKDADGTTNFLTYGNGWCGLVYNADIIDGVKYKLPVTTDELNYLTMDLTGDTSLGAKTKPWIFFSSSGGGAYWSYPMTAWQVQYDGVDYYNNNMLQLKDEAGNSPSKEVLLKKDGRYEALKVASQIITPTSVHPESTNTNHTKVQTLFMNGEAVFMPNGSWLLNESGGTEDNVDVQMMKIPVISSIINVLPDKSVADDAELSALVKAIDAGETALRSDNFTYEVTQADFDRVKEARNVMYNNGSEQYVFIPEYSNAKEGAKEFLKYFYSDDALATYMQYTGSTNSANLTDKSKFDISTLTPWGQQQAKFADELTAITGKLDKASVFMNTGLDSFMGLSYPGPLSAQNAKDRKTVDQLWDMLTKTVNENWEDWV